MFTVCIGSFCRINEYLILSYHMQQICKAHKELCDHMGIEGESHVDSKTNGSSHAKHMYVIAHVKVHKKLCDHMVIAHESHVVTRGHVNNMCILWFWTHVLHMNPHVHHVTLYGGF